MIPEDIIQSLQFRVEAELGEVLNANAEDREAISERVKSGIFKALVEFCTEVVEELDGDTSKFILIIKEPLASILKEKR